MNTHHTHPALHFSAVDYILREERTTPETIEENHSKKTSKLTLVQTTLSEKERTTSKALEGIILKKRSKLTHVLIIPSKKRGQLLKH